MSAAWNEFCRHSGHNVTLAPLTYKLGLKIVELSPVKGPVDWQVESVLGLRAREIILSRASTGGAHYMKRVSTSHKIPRRLGCGTALQ